MAIPTGALPPEAVIGVAGAGAMGAGIAQVAAAAGHPVRLYDVREGAAEEGIGRLRQGLDRRVARGRMTADARDALLGRITAVGRLELLAPCALVVEAIVEDLEVKRGLLRELEGICAAETILASNTSSLSITALAAGLDHPERVVGMHFFNPVPVMRLVEVVRGLATDPAAAGCVRATAAGWG
ncbi:MAG: 3-hydroxyacyl-CoA dehydrogenase NAD-binding domain-containing protein, partial [Gammaproteobacteria bacterium]|nr:3-hydroxyacyl-CoA dehydrogenase NAD-binding domain-containing protein [Gammaproteobacteria bacterium]